MPSRWRGSDIKASGIAKRYPDTNLWRLTLGRSARRRLGSDAANAIFDVDRHHCRGIRPPEFSDDPIAGKPGVRLLEFVSHEQFGRVDRRLPGDQVRVRRDAGDPRERRLRTRGPAPACAS